MRRNQSIGVLAAVTFLFGLTDRAGAQQITDMRIRELIKEASLQAGAAVATTLDTYNGGIAQSVPWGGGSFAVQLNNSRSTTTNLTSFFNPTFNTNWSGSYVQPLLRNFRIDSTRQQLQVTKLS